MVAVVSRFSGAHMSMCWLLGTHQKKGLCTCTPSNKNTTQVCQISAQLHTTYSTQQHSMQARLSLTCYLAVTRDLGAPKSQLLADENACACLYGAKNTRHSLEYPQVL